jgi:opacity protein-like surface antigen
MRKTMYVTAAVAAAMAATTAPAAAQSLPIPLAVEGRVDAAFPMGRFGDVAGTGVGFGAGASIGLTPGVGVYGTYSHTRFGAGVGSSETPDATDSGFSVGVTAALPGATPNVSPWVGGGLVFHQLELGGSGAGIEEDLGFEVGAGVAIAVAPNVRLTPGIGYRSYSASVPALGGLTARDVNVQYLTLGVGLNIAF